MQVTCFAFDWKAVKSRPTAVAVYEELICSDEVDRYTTQLPDDAWCSDSATQHFETADELEECVEDAPKKMRPALRALSRIISTGESVDELGLSQLSDGCYFVSMSPETVRELLAATRAIDLSCVCALSEEAKEWCGQWLQALSFADKEGLGLIGHCG